MRNLIVALLISLLLTGCSGNDDIPAMTLELEKLQLSLKELEEFNADLLEQINKSNEEQGELLSHVDALMEEADIDKSKIESLEENILLFEGIVKEVDDSTVDYKDEYYRLIDELEYFLEYEHNHLLEKLYGSKVDNSEFVPTVVNDISLYMREEEVIDILGEPINESFYYSPDGFRKKLEYDDLEIFLNPLFVYEIIVEVDSTLELNGLKHELDTKDLISYFDSNYFRHRNYSEIGHADVQRHFYYNEEGREFIFLDFGGWTASYDDLNEDDILTSIWIHESATFYPGN